MRETTNLVTESIYKGSLEKRYCRVKLYLKMESRT